MKYSFIALLFIILGASTAVAQNSDYYSFISANTGLSVEDGDAGINLGVKWKGQYRHILGTVNFVDLNFVPRPADNTRYREETFDNGRTVCRDTQNGQFANDEKCASTTWDIFYAASLDIHYAFNPSVNGNWALGAGARLGNVSTIYGSAILTFKNFSRYQHPYVRFNLGPKFVQLSIGLSWLTN